MTSNSFLQPGFHSEIKAPRLNCLRAIVIWMSDRLSLARSEFQIFPDSLLLLVSLPSQEMAAPPFQLLRPKSLELSWSPLLLLHPTINPSGILLPVTSEINQNWITPHRLYCCHPNTRNHSQHLLPKVFKIQRWFFPESILLVMDDDKFVNFCLYHSFYFLLLGIPVFKKGVFSSSHSFKNFLSNNMHSQIILLFTVL